MTNALPDDRFWAKLQRDDQGRVTSWHSLRGHCADVSACFEALLQRSVLRHRLARLLGWEDLDAVHIARLSVLAAIHDAGKANLGFQLRRDPNARNGNGHVSEMVAIVESEMANDILGALSIQPMLQWFELEGDHFPLIDMLCASWAHHGKAVDPNATYFKSHIWKADESLDPLHALQDLGEAIQRWFPEAFEKQASPFPDEPAFRHAFNGLLNLVDWLGSTERYFPYDNGQEGRMTFAREKAQQLLSSMHLTPGQTRQVLGDEPVDFETINGFSPYDMQQACMDLPIDPSGNLTILESDTGSGKTEAALSRYIRLFQDGAVDGLYFAVPTRSAAKQLQQRIQRSIRRLFGEDGPPTILAIPGYIRIDDIDGDAHALPGFDVQWPDERPNIQELGWAAENPRRFLAAPIAVGTVDQVLMSTLAIKYAHLRATALHRHFLVVDELHSSSEYMHHLLHQVLDHHLAAGGHALLMSATLGTAERISYSTANRGEIPPPETARTTDYPLITHVDASRTDPTSIHAASSNYQKKVVPTLHPLAHDPQAIAQRALSYAQHGARVLIIRNLVDDCVATQNALQAMSDDSTLLFGPKGQIAPHHSRFAAPDRRALDLAIEDYFGKPSQRQSIVAVATQTVEQSLDIDADILLTDLCPADVLLQRIGRLHRHDARQRPTGFERAQVEVLVPEQRSLGEAISHDGKGLGGPHGLGTVYGDLRILEATWRIIESSDQWVIPDDNRRIVEEATHPEELRAITQELGDPWPQHETYIEGVKYGERTHGRLVTIKRDQHFYKSGIQKDSGLIKTRLGNDDWMVELPEPLTSPFGQRVKYFTIPARWLSITPEADEDLIAHDVSQQSQSITFSIAHNSFIYDRQGLRPLQPSSPTSGAST